MGFCVLYYQTIIFTGVYQRWTTYALKPKSVSKMNFRANSKKTQSLGKNGCRQKRLDKRLMSDTILNIKCKTKKKDIGKTIGDNTKRFKVIINQHISDCKTGVPICKFVMYTIVVLSILSILYIYVLYIYIYICCMYIYIYIYIYIYVCICV